ncbi:hypothetical protein [Candidatus Viridilinea mediisalina]|uniref:Uncharacterized protein n=1 Tax=Candidatus Viridilinea mediisalina TaxID=2024553 RepID=A0A2A6RMK3_9CHLR|nr:hypothetical protein [Candidatus Viridilinea mediisalina]PDW04089.1 hypothetical protein CJ255_05200 [Candidatus Viridilinea mediisalina]
MKKGYLYRLVPVDAERLRALIADLVGTPCWSFGGAAQWDFEPKAGTGNLRAITQWAEIDLKGDFGHAFSGQAEVRWKRHDEKHYDVLVLTETVRKIDGATTLAAGWDVETPTERAIIQDGQRPSISYSLYHAPNGAVQFLRYRSQEGSEEGVALPENPT